MERESTDTKVTAYSSPRRAFSPSRLCAPSSADAETTRLPFSSRVRLVNLLLAKSVLEALFVAALAVGFYYQTFNPYFRGSVDAADEHHVSGWVVNEAHPQTRVEVYLYINGRFAASRIADQSRPDVRAAGRAADDWHGFVFNTPALLPGEHEARVYAIHESGGGLRRALQLVGQPRSFPIKEGTNETLSIASPEGKEER